MGYACPVCADPQADAEHLANHLAFTAMLGDTEHEAWLADHAPDWDEADAESLAVTVVEHADEIEFPQVFEDTTDPDPDQDQGHGQTQSQDRDANHERTGALFDDETVESADAARERARRDRNLSLDDEAEQILQDAREMTRQMNDTATEQDEDETE